MEPIMENYFDGSAILILNWEGTTISANETCYNTWNRVSCKNNTFLIFRVRLTSLRTTPVTRVFGSNLHSGCTRFEFSVHENIHNIYLPLHSGFDVGNSNWRVFMLLMYDERPSRLFRTVQLNCSRAILAVKKYMGTIHVFSSLSSIYYFGL